MRLISTALVIAGIALVGPAAAKPSAKTSARSAPEAADQTLGMALMSASVDNGGFVMHSSGVLSVTVTQPGVAEIVFERSLTGCDVVASATNANVNTTYGVYVVNARRLDDNTLRVLTFNAGALTNRPFAVIAYCAG